MTTKQIERCETHVKLLGSQGINPDPDADPATEGVPFLSKPLFAPTTLVLILVLAVALTLPLTLLLDPVPAPAGSSGTLHPAPTGKLDIETEDVLELALRPTGALEEDPFIAANIAARLFSFARAISSGVCGFRLYVCDCGLVVGVVERDEMEAVLCGGMDGALVGFDIVVDAVSGVVTGIDFETPFDFKAALSLSSISTSTDSIADQVNTPFPFSFPFTPISTSDPFDPDPEPEPISPVGRPNLSDTPSSAPVILTSDDSP
jgi:hypothetical protein